MNTARKTSCLLHPFALLLANLVNELSFGRVVALHVLVPPNSFCCIVANTSGHKHSHSANYQALKLQFIEPFGRKRVASVWGGGSGGVGSYTGHWRHLTGFLCAWPQFCFRSGQLQRLVPMLLNTNWGKGSSPHMINERSFVAFTFLAHCQEESQLPVHWDWASFAFVFGNIII